MENSEKWEISEEPLEEKSADFSAEFPDADENEPETEEKEAANLYTEITEKISEAPIVQETTYSEKYLSLGDTEKIEKISLKIDDLTILGSKVAFSAA